jgi:hypothetical protein
MQPETSRTTDLVKGKDGIYRVPHHIEDCVNHVKLSFKEQRQVVHISQRAGEIIGVGIMAAAHLCLGLIIGMARELQAIHYSARVKSKERQRAIRDAERKAIAQQHKQVNIVNHYNIKL